MSCCDSCCHARCNASSNWRKFCTLQCNLAGDQYIRDVLQPVVIPHFDNHPLATWPVYMDDNDRPHRARAAVGYQSPCQTCSSMSVCRQWTFSDSPWIQTVSNCSCWQTSIGQPVLFEYGTGCEWHPSHRRSRLAWCLARRKIHWSDESWFLLHVTDSRMRVWRHKNTAYAPWNIQPTVPYGGGSVMVWGCISHD
jgi:hypothetical protein